MASLIDELFATLSREEEIYKQIIPISEEKTEILVKGDLKELEQITQKEQLLIDQASALGKQRESVIANIGTVLNKDAATLDLGTIVKLLEKQPEESRRLAQIHDSLKAVMKRLVAINEKNKNLIENSLEMVEFNMNVIQSTRMSPGVNNYDKNASSSYQSDGNASGFDAKQ